MREYLRGRERKLAHAGGIFIPGVMILMLLLAPLWGWALTYGLLKAAAACFVVTAVLWYFADDAGDSPKEWDVEEEVEDDEPSTEGELEEPLDYLPAIKVEAETVLGSGERTVAPENIVGRRSSDKLRAFPGMIEDDAPGESPSPTYVFKGEVGGSEGLRARGFPKESLLPDDAVLFREYDGWALYSSAAEKALYLRTTDYHPKPLRITKEMLAELLDGLKN